MNFLRLNAAYNAWLVPVYGWPFPLGYASQLEARGVVPRSTTSVSVKVYADKQADVHLAIYSAPLTVNGADSELIAQADALAVLNTEQTVAVDIPSGGLAGDAIEPDGTITITAASLSVTGSGTAFPTDGTWTGYEIQAKNGDWYQIASVTSATALTLTGPAARVSAAAGDFLVRRPDPAAFVVRLWVDNIVGGTLEAIARDTSITDIDGQPQIPGVVTVTEMTFQ